MVTVGLAVQDEGLVHLIQQIERQFSAPARASLYARWGDAIREQLRIEYPSQSNAPLPARYDWGDGKRHKFKSLRAQRGFFRALRTGRAHVPYRRTGASQRLLQTAQVQLAVQDADASLTITIPIQAGGVDPRWWLGEDSEQSYYFRTSTGWQGMGLRSQLQRQQARIETIGAALLENELTQIGGVE